MSNLIEALAKAKLEFPEIKKSRTANVPTKSGGSYEYNYADISDILAAVNPVLSKHGLILYFKSKVSKDPLGDIILAKVAHVSGQEIESEGFIPDCDNAQSLGSWKTYMKRYLACEVLGINAEDDDDGQTAETKPKRPISVKPKENYSDTPNAGPLKIKIQKPTISPDKFITLGAKTGTPISDLSPAEAKEWSENALTHLRKANLDPETSTVDMARTYRAIRSMIQPEAPQMGFESFSGNPMVEHDLP